MNGDYGKTGLEERAKRAFDESVAGLDGQTRSRLARARARALEGADRPRWLRWPGATGLLPAGALAAAVLAAFFVLNGPERPSPGMDLAELSDLDILLGEDDLELYEELEFYAWLEEQPEILELLDDDDIG